MSTETQIKQAVILAGGKGERLRPLTNDRPKPMVDVNGRPFLEYLISLLKKNGINEIVILLGYLPEKVIEHFGDGRRFGINIRYHISGVDNKMGTRVRLASNLFQEKFMLLYGDIYWPMDIKKMTEAYEKLKTPAMMTVYNNQNGDGEFGKKSTISLAPGGLVAKYADLCEDPDIKGLDIGFFVFEKSIMSLMPAHDCGFQEEFLQILIKKKMLGAYHTEEKYCTITNLEFLKSAEGYLKTRGISV